jgi:TetR/AcrR family transcriptional repressor of nem operon
MLAQGYEGVGLGPTLAAAGVPKGSFYHYFASKEDFALAVVDAYANHYAQVRGRIFGDRSRSPLTRLLDYFEELERELVAEFPAGGCLYGVLSQTTAPHLPALQARLAEGFRDWQDSITSLLVEAREAGKLGPEQEPAALAAEIIDAYEGLLVRAKVARDPALYRQIHERVRRLVGLSA